MNYKPKIISYKLRKFYILLLIIALIIILFPVYVVCGAPNYTCASVYVDKSNKIHTTYYYEIEPFGIKILEYLTQTNIKIYYKNGTKTE